MSNLTVFLGGTCDNDMWRQDLIALIESKVDYYNPQKGIDEWCDADKAKEIEQRKTCDIIFYNITQASSIVSIAEAIDDSNKRPERTIVCLTCTDTPMKWAAIDEMITNNGAVVVSDLDDAAIEIITMANELKSAK